MERILCGCNDREKGGMVLHTREAGLAEAM
jgi:hypothetical protein